MDEKADLLDPSPPSFLPAGGCTRRRGLVDRALRFLAERHRSRGIYFFQMRDPRQPGARSPKSRGRSQRGHWLKDNKERQSAHTEKLLHRCSLCRAMKTNLQRSEKYAVS